MIRTHRLALAVAALLSLSVAPAMAQSDRFAAEMNSETVTVEADPGATGGATFQTLANPLVVTALSAPDPVELSLLAERRRNQDRHGQPLEVAFARETGASSVGLDKLQWQPLAGGAQGAQLRVQSDGAVALRAALEFVAPANGARINIDDMTLRFRGDDGQTFEVAGRDLAAGEANWSPVVRGQTLTIEIVLAAGSRAQALTLRIPQLSHFDVDPASTDAAIGQKVGESDYCERDIVCRTSPPSGFTSTANAVARMVFTKSGSSYLCTGTLLNNGFSPKKRTFWTANHCIGTQSVANTLQTYWFYQVTTCNGSTVSSSARTLTGGAYLRHNNSARDTALLELKTAPPAGAVYAGWSSSAIAATSTAIEGIHHPAGDVKKYSLGTVTQLSGSIDGKGPFYRVRWSTGVTEGGSSGSGLFTVSGGNYQLRGGLYGGTSYCSAPTDPDYYSRFSDVYSSFSSYLTP
ncbi:trypsin-like peptidase domain-containing protein [Tahibacter sp.]|uniref:trypsin-like serine peptidase n=1 Tax=Tahibacter sp. TaxID=2056211 RepID=UPI0028C472EB|nr:trypsin-like peptidase domain-containing protein [Tahibacter sp.]